MTAAPYTFAGQPFAVELLVTDTLAYDVVAHTAKTITVRRRVQGSTSRRDPMADQGPYPVVLTSTEPCPEAELRVLRLRKDGTFRSYQGGRPLRFTNTSPETRTDYRY